MNVHVKHRSVECPPTMVAEIKEKCQRFLHLVPASAYMEVVVKQLPKSGPQGDKAAEVIVDIPGRKPVIRFLAHGASLIEAVDRVLDRLDGAISIEKDKQSDYHYTGLSPKEWSASNQNRD